MTTPPSFARFSSDTRRSLSEVTSETHARRSGHLQCVVAEIEVGQQTAGKEI